MHIAEIDKPEFTRCPHLKEGYNGCSIYKDRPAGCSAFTCLWKHGLGSNKQRPDKSGIMVIPAQKEKVMQVWNTGDGEWTPAALDMIGLLKAHGHMVIQIKKDNRRTIL
jgi:Fe-S-cluster containining protein